MRIGSTKVTFNLPLKLWESFQERATAKGITVSEQLRRAMWVFQMLDDQVAAGRNILIEDPTGKEPTTRLVLEPLES